MVELSRNNLDKALSPYLRQHQNNPIHWQEWTLPILQSAQKENKLLFVSVGYSTCHWCHVMAHDTFEDVQIARFLNEHFISIKIDREQRPDIDQFLMDFLVQTQKSGGWPLNVFLTSSIKPIFATTYVAPQAKYGMPGFLSILQEVVNFNSKNFSDNSTFLPQLPKIPTIPQEKILPTIFNQYDWQEGGFGSRNKFPPYNTLLFLLHYYENDPKPELKKLIRQSLDAMAKNGLHDHLQGGFFRYSVDKYWNIPHFEKMLYDQAMMLWLFSAAFHVLKQPAYKIIVKKLIQCLNEVFKSDGLFYSAMDADTKGMEGATYLWSNNELKEKLSSEEYQEFTKVYSLAEASIVEGKYHLKKKTLSFVENLEQKLLTIRKGRDQPFCDKKILTSWNALTGIGLIMASRYCGFSKAKEQAQVLFRKLCENHYIDKKLNHSSFRNQVQHHEFLEDYAATLLFATYLYEETGEYLPIITKLNSRINSFYDQEWFEANNADFQKIPMKIFDSPTPSSQSLLKLARLRLNVLLNKPYMPISYKIPLYQDFFNISALISQGNFYVYGGPKLRSWGELSLNSLQYKSEDYSVCYQGKCQKIDPITDSNNNLKELGSK